MERGGEILSRIREGTGIGEERQDSRRGCEVGGGWVAAAAQQQGVDPRAKPSRYGNGQSLQITRGVREIESKGLSLDVALLVEMRSS